MTRVVSVVGARPQFVKLAALTRAFGEEVDHAIVHTGQHYESEMSQKFFEDLDIPNPHQNLLVGSKPHGQQTGEMMAKLEPVLETLSPDCVVVYGDTNSTLAAALVSTKLQMWTVHLEAGLRSFNRKMPEELNRIVVDHLSDLCLAPSRSALRQLGEEHLAKRSHFVGDVMVDILFEQLAAMGIDPDARNRKPREKIVATIHRQENTGSRAQIEGNLACLNSMPVPVELYVHPRLRELMRKFEIMPSAFPNIQFLEAVGYNEMLRVLSEAIGVITDSGGLQKEAFLLNVPCVTLRTETEWTDTIELGWNVLAHYSSPGIAEFLLGRVERVFGEMPYGDGAASKRAAEAIAKGPAAGFF